MKETKAEAADHGGAVRRRTLLELAFGAVAAILGAVVGAPVAIAFLDPTYRKTVRLEGRQEGFGPLSSFPVGEPVRRDVIARRRDAWDRSSPQTIGGVWLIRRGDREIDAFSVVCPHLGCQVGVDRPAGVFSCPCHESAFAISDGHVIYGPSPRGLDPLLVEVTEDGEVNVTYQRFVIGITERRKA